MHRLLGPMVVANKTLFHSLDVSDNNKNRKITYFAKKTFIIIISNQKITFLAEKLAYCLMNISFRISKSDVTKYGV
jgi:hypothetical protein